MANKVIIGILVFLVVLCSGLGYYSYTLSQQINSLGGQLSVFQIEQAARIDAISGELTTFRGETLTRISSLIKGLDGNLTRIGTLENEIDQTLASIGTLEDRTVETTAKIDALEGEIRGAAEVSHIVIDANKVYQRVSQATVRISNGERTIGSGFILDNEAHVVTAHHVVENLSQIYVVLPDGRISKATNAGSCLYSDVAVLTLEDKLAIEPLTLADSASVRLGEPVATIGNPFDLMETLTTGIVSQTNRFAEIDYDLQTRWVANLIQFDAAVNFGNSGCPLVNSEGEVIGMVIARIEPNEGDGIYYAVSSNKVKRVTASLIAQGSFDYPWIGVGIANLTPQMVQTRALETTNGILVGEILAESPASAAGIEVDDIIMAFDGIPIRNVADLTSYLGEHKSPGEAATITLIRDTVQLELSLEVGQQP